MGKLSPKQEQFCLEYIQDSNGHQAALRAGYAKASARMQASRMLSKDNIQARIAELAAEVKTDRLWSAEELRVKTQELLQMALDRDDLPNANRSLDMLHKTRGNYIDKQEISGPGGRPIETDTEWTISFVQAPGKPG